MVITYLGGEFIKVQFGEITLAFNPPSKDSKLKASRFGADVALVSLNHPDFNGVENVSHGDKRPFVIQGPGEYEIKDVVVRGFPTESKYGVAIPNPKDSVARSAEGGFREKHINTVYPVALEGIKLCFLGALGTAALPAELKEELDDIDVLFVSTGGNGVLSAVDANKLAVALEPRLVIPMHYAGLADTAALKQFLKEAGEEKITPQEKLTLKKKDLEGKEGEVIVLKAGQ